MRGTPVVNAPRSRNRTARRNRTRGSSALATLALAGACAQEAPPLPDLVLITVDALPAATLGCFGGPPDAGRELCAQAEGGTRFGWAVSAARGEASAAATVHSGLPPDRHPVDDVGASFLPSRVETIAERLGRAGFRTAAFVTSPRLNRVRRLDQGFEAYEDRLPSLSDRGAPAALSGAVREWLARTSGPRFVWIHLSEAPSLDALDRTLDRIDVAFGDRRRGVLVAALAGAPERPALHWERHRIPLLWRPPTPGPSDAPDVSFRLAGLEDVRPTLLAAGGLLDGPLDDPEALVGAGRDLGALARAPRSGDAEDERRILLGGGPSDGAVGLATATHVYARDPAAFDGSGSPLPTETLGAHRARFLPLPLPDPLRHPAPRSAALRPGPWRRDVLATDSPVPSLEFHLARRLAEGRSQDPR